MTRTVRTLAALAAAALAAIFDPDPAGALSPADQRDVARIEAYLNSVRSLQASFVQVSSNGGSAEGKLYLRRPRRVRFDYSPPAAIQIYAQGYWLVYVDTELEEVSQVPLSETIAGLLVARKVRLSGDVTVDRIERSARLIRVHLYQTKQPQAGRLILTFGAAPLRLRNWMVVDAQGVQTRVLLVKPSFNVFIRDSVFAFDASKYEKPFED